jgi:hypothetical protein
VKLSPEAKKEIVRRLLRGESQVQVAEGQDRQLGSFFEVLTQIVVSD